MEGIPGKLLVTGALILGGTSASLAQPPPPTPALVDPASQPDAASPEVLTRGPVHEAFAQPIVFDPQPGPIVQKRPPEPIEEMPPDQRPEGANVVWVGGYWSWDDERKDFLWTSGIWRDLPPGRQWVPGYWTPVTDGFQWVSGYWAPTEQKAATYLPKPPTVVEAGPNIPAPAPSYLWTPGYWYWCGNRYVWRPGYWQRPRPDWVWVPPHYVWTPGGYLFVPGFWDYTLEARGMVFAPVYLPPAVIVRPAFVFTPSVVIATNVMVDNFFVRPSWGFYYFGDYYAPTYAASGFGFSMAFAFGSSRVAYDPIFTHYTAINTGWATSARESFNYRVAHVDARPAHTFLAQQTRIERGMAHNEIIALSLASVAASRAEMMSARATTAGARADIVNARTGLAAMRLERVDQAQREEMAQRSHSLQQFQSHRLQQETGMIQARESRIETRTNLATARLDAAAAVRASRAPTVALPRSPVASRPLSTAAGPGVSARNPLPRNPQPRPTPVNPGPVPGPVPGPRVLQRPPGNPDRPLRAGQPRVEPRPSRPESPAVPRTLHGPDGSPATVGTRPPFPRQDRPSNANLNPRADASVSRALVPANGRPQPTIGAGWPGPQPRAPYAQTLSARRAGAGPYSRPDPSRPANAPAQPREKDEKQ